MPFLSVIVPTMRAGGIDFIVDALAEQEYTDFELVLVDALYRHRAEQVDAYAKNKFVRVVHVEPKPNPFPVASFCSMSNAGLVAATGDVAVFMVDYSRPRPDCLRRHADFHRDSDEYEGFMGPHRYARVEVDPAFPRYAGADVGRYEEDLRAGRLSRHLISIGRATSDPAEPWTVDGGNVAHYDADPKLRHPAGPVSPLFFHGKNESVWLEDALSVNGWDEELDGTHCWQDSDFADRLSVKGGVRWTLDPDCLVEIANPRGVFPLARRLRDFRENEKIWQAKRAAGYPTPNRWNLRDARGKNGSVGEGAAGEGAPPESPAAPEPALFDGGVGAVVGERKLRVAMIYGEFSSAIHGPFDFAKLSEAGLTGSEGSFFNLARSLAERGHQVVVLAPAVAPHEHESGAVMLPLRPTIDKLPQIGADAVLAWNEPDYLAHAPAGALRVVNQQLNDWLYCKHPQWQSLTDLYVFPSESSRGNHLPQLRGGHESVIVPNSVDLDLFGYDADVPSRHRPDREPHRVVYCSSPDRGLHHLLAMWPQVRARVPDAELKVFYRLGPWLEGALDLPDEVGRRARYIAEALRRMRDGWGIEVVGPVPNREMARQLRAASVLAYPCDPVRYTEGFGCSVLDACAAGCLPVISDADALAEVHGRACVLVPGKPVLNRQMWIDEVVHQMTHLAIDPIRKTNMAAHAEAHSRQKVAEQWERLLLSRVRS